MERQVSFNRRGSDAADARLPMLPRIARLDRAFATAIQSYMQARSRSSPVLRDIKSHVIHEGKGSAIRRGANELDQTKMIEANVETRMDFDDLDNIDTQYVIAKANEISAQFERQFSTNLFQTLDETTAKTGQRVDAAGAPLTNETLIEVFDKMLINFEHSDHGDVTIVTAPGMASSFQKLSLEMDANPEVRQKWNRMMDGKRNEFREREINRNLAG